jgi:Ser/Thr protein kinase RdoA (MazF antagonist)
MSEYDEASVLEALKGQLRGHAFVAHQFELIRHGSASVYRVVGAGAVVRITRSPLVDPDDVEAWLEGIASLAEQGAPVLAPLLRRPVDVGEAWATLWPEASPVSRSSFKLLGAALKRLHGAETPAVFADRGDRRMATVVSRLETAEALSVPSGYVELIRDRLKRVEAARTSIDHLLHVPAHADAYVGNLLVHENRPVLIDLDDMCSAPRELDFAPSLVSARRFEDIRAAYEDLLDGYDACDPPLDADALAVFVEQRELTMISWLATLWGVEPRSRTVLEHRLSSWDDPEAVWPHM